MTSAMAASIPSSRDLPDETANRHHQPRAGLHTVFQQAVFMKTQRRQSDRRTD